MALSVACAGLAPLEKVTTSDGLEVHLRSVTGSKSQHPAQIEPARIASILASLRTVRASARGSRDVFEDDALERISAGLAEGLRLAGTSQQVSVVVLHRKRALKVLHTTFLTSFLAHIADERLVLDFERVDWELAKGQPKDRIPYPRPGEHPMEFRLEVGAGMQSTDDPQVIAVDWRDSRFDPR